MLTGKFVVKAENVTEDQAIRIERKLNHWAAGDNPICVIPLAEGQYLYVDQIVYPEEGEELGASPVIKPHASDRGDSGCSGCFDPLCGQHEAEVDYTAEWFNLVQIARKLRPEAYQDWCFAVGMEGSDKERYLKGVKALQMVFPGTAVRIKTD